MRCPKCGHVRQQGDAAPDYECPRCGVVYAKALARTLSDEEFEQAVAADRARRESQAKAMTPAPPETARERSHLVECEDCSAKVSRLAYTCPSCGRPFGGQASPVRVMDIKMTFTSMVGFMVKWAIASIPAIIILCLIVMLAIMILNDIVRR